jgi:NAD(P)-dependent dehydrogenase (short-subunit alcohol dehydrogenase family)
LTITGCSRRWFALSVLGVKMSALGGKVAIVTGASSGIGFVTAELFAAEGASVVVGARREDHLKRLVDKISASGGRAVALAGDVQDEDYAQALVNTAVGEFGGLDIALNNAATMGVLGAISQMSRQNWTTTIETNLTGAFLGAKYQIPAMQARGGGSLIFTSTFVGHTVGFPGTVAYAASKAGLIGMTQVLAAEFGPVGIRVNALLPGGTDTDMAREMNNSEEAKAFVRSLHALKRLARPEEIALRAVSRLGRIQLHDRDCASGRWWRFDNQNLIAQTKAPRRRCA